MIRQLERRVGLRTQLLLGILGPLVILGVALHYVHQRNVSARLHYEVESRASALAGGLAALAIDAVLTQDRGRLDRLTVDLSSFGPDIAYVFVADPTGAILAHSFSGGFPESLLSLARASGLRITHLDTGEATICHAAVPLLDGSPGTVHVGLSEWRSDAQTQAMMVWLNGLFLTVGILICSLLGLTGTLAVASLRATAGRIAARAHLPAARETPLPEAGPREVAELIAAFNRTRHQLRMAHEQAIETERLATAGRLAAGIVHEVNNPLSGALACVRAIAAGMPEPGRTVEYAGLAEEALERISAVLRRMADFAVAPICYEDQAIDWSELTASACETIRSVADRAGVRVDVEVDETGAGFVACPPLLEQVLVNLLTNAIEASPPGETVGVAVRKADGAVTVEVSDRGAGMPLELVERLGEPFFTTKGSGAGLGLGLFLVRGALGRYHATMRIDSQPMKGTCVRLRFPVEDRCPGGLGPPKGADEQHTAGRG